jgi:hypothetical protein
MIVVDIIVILLNFYLWKVSYMYFNNLEKI